MCRTDHIEKEVVEEEIFKHIHLDQKAFLVFVSNFVFLELQVCANCFYTLIANYNMHFNSKLLFLN